MEPREADKLPIPSLDRVRRAEDALKTLKPQLSQALRSGNLADAVAAVDKVVLQDIDDDALKALRLAREVLFQRRQARARSVTN